MDTMPLQKKSNKKRIFLLIGIAILAIIVRSAVLSLFRTDSNYERRTIPFEEMVYSRPDPNAIFEKFDYIIDVLEKDSTYEEQFEAVKSIETYYWDFYSMKTIAEIKSDIDTTDAFYQAECDFYDQYTPLVEQKTEEYYIASSKSKYKDQLEANYFGDGNLDGYDDGATYSDEYVALLQKEAELVDEYYNLINSPTIEYQGREQALDDIMQNNPNNEEYRAIMELYYDKYNVLLGNIYVELLKVRQEISVGFGFDSYIEFAYDSYYRDYTPEEADSFMEGIKDCVVPLYKRLNTDDLYYQSDSNAGMSEEQVLKIMNKAASKMSYEIDDIYDYMDDYGLYDISASDKKISSSYQTYIKSYDAPFIMMQSYGDVNDLLTFAHEFGHFTDAYINYNYYQSNEDSESASQSMEYLLLNYLDACSDSEIENIKRTCYISILDTYIYQGCYNEFEERVYELEAEELTLENINKIAGESTEEFGIKADNWEDYYQVSWVDIGHFYTSPFYVIGYCISNNAALQIYMQETEEKGSGVDTYLEMLDRDRTMSYIQNLERVGLKSPFAEDNAEITAMLLRKYFYSED